MRCSTLSLKILWQLCSAIISIKINRVWYFLAHDMFGSLRTECRYYFLRNDSFVSALPLKIQQLTMRTSIARQFSYIYCCTKKNHQNASCQICERQTIRTWSRLTKDRTYTRNLPWRQRLEAAPQWYLSTSFRHSIDNKANGEYGYMHAYSTGSSLWPTASFHCPRTK